MQITSLVGQGGAVGGEAEAAGGDPAAEAGLVDPGHDQLAGGQGVDPVGVDVDAGHLEAGLGGRAGQRQPDVALADDGHPGVAGQQAAAQGRAWIAW